jgi:salicylate hydroxylase
LDDAIVTDRSDVVVVGGGIGGLTGALAIARQGHSVTILERESRFTEVGAGIQLAPNATRVLGELGLLTRVIDVGVLPRRLVLADAIDRRELTSLDLTDFTERFGGPYVVLHRGDLLSIVVDACRDAGVELITDADVERVDDLGHEVRAICRGGRVFTGAVLIGADGLRSRLRQPFVDDDLICSGYVAYRGAVPMEAVQRHADLRDVVAWIGPGLHLVQYPLRSGRMYNQVAVFRSAAYERGDPDWGNPDELAERFAGCCDHVRESVPLLGQDHRWPMYDRLPSSTWVRGRVALLGDAAHPMLQYLAQGACQAIQDADAIAGVLAHARFEDADHVEASLHHYERTRAPHAARVQRAARTWGEIWHVDGIAKLLRDELLLVRAPDDMRHVDWLYGNRVSTVQPA